MGNYGKERTPFTENPQKSKEFWIKKYEIKTFKLENRSVEKVNLMERNDESL